MASRNPSTLPLRGRVDATRPGGVTSRSLRARVTDAERKMWFILRGLEIPRAHFRRQVRIGNYFADFLSHHLKLIIEVDGSQHFETAGIARDEKRTAFLSTEGFQVIRFDNFDVLKNPRGVADKILSAVATLTPTPTPNPSPQGGGANESGTTDA